MSNAKARLDFEQVATFNDTIYKEYHVLSTSVSIYEIYAKDKISKITPRYIIIYYSDVLFGLEGNFITLEDMIKTEADEPVEDPDDNLPF